MPRWGAARKRKKLSKTGGRFVFQGESKIRSISARSTFERVVRATMATTQPVIVFFTAVCAKRFSLYIIKIN